MQIVEATIEKSGRVKLLAEVSLPSRRRALLTILDEEPKDEAISKKDTLLKAFKKAQKAELFKDIDDPSEWQRRLRDEWD
jgi:hypothetical protein